MDSLKLDTSCTALILVDLQRGIVGMPTRPYSGSFVVEKGASLAAAFRRMYATVVYVRVDLSNMMSIALDLSHGDPNNPPPSSASEFQPYPVELWPESRRRGEGNSPLSQRGRGGSLGH
jgi:nicotinamidase-related amidase